MGKKNADKRYLAKVIGESKWMALDGLDGQSFYITEDKTKAHPFTDTYVKGIVASTWGNKKWEKEVHNG